MGRAIPTPNAIVSQTIDGVWWKQTASVSGFVTLSNTTDRAITAQLDVTGSDGAQLGRYPVSLAARNTETINLQELSSSSVTGGGLVLTYTAPVDAILISGGLQNYTSGYSATMSFRPREASDDKQVTTPITLTELGLMTGNQDPMMLLSPDTTFHPFSVIHNVSAEPASLVPELFWMINGKPQRYAGAQS